MSDARFGNGAATLEAVQPETETGPLVSIVTPFYNTREFLTECIESVLRQTYEHWEYILVDNCSTDGSSDIAAQYTSRFPDRIRLIHTKSFVSQVQNYNFALTSIAPSSKYCKMVQADDWLFPECVDRMVKVAEAHPGVGIVSAYELEGEAVRLDGLPYSLTEVGGREACRLYFLKGVYLFGTPTSLLLRSELIRHRVPFYDERYAPFEDGHACFDLLKDWNLGFVHQVLTFSRRNNGSILSRVLADGLLLYFRLVAVVAHGREYLTEQEYEWCLEEAERHYLVYLNKCAWAVHRSGPEFWELHRNALASIGYTLDWRLLFKWVPRALLEKAWGAFWAKCDRKYSATRDGDKDNEMGANATFGVQTPLGGHRTK
ncbi:MAG: glycosyltransferase family 2 protein [Terracidiphilus sp.]